MQFHDCACGGLRYGLRMQKLLARLNDLRGWRGKLACFAAGALTTLAFAPFHAWPVLLVTISFLFLMLDKARHWRSGALYALAYGYGYCMAGTYWIANSLLVDAHQFGWLVPFCVLGLSLVMALWFALFGALYRLARGPLLWVNVVRFAILWTAVEYARSVGAFGFPWNLIGSAVLGDIHVAQLDALVGPFGTGFFVMLLALTPIFWLKPEASRILRRGTAIAALLAVGAAYGYGYLHIPPAAALGDTRVRIVQANIAQSFKWTPEGRMEAASLYAGMSHITNNGPIPPIHLWPETAVPYTFRAGTQLPQQISTVLPPGGLLLTGAMRSEGEYADYHLYNSIVAIDRNGEWLGSYDKHQLVPFGEFVPLRSVLPIEKITHGNIDFSAGAAHQPFELKNAPPVRPLICYEVIFPWAARSEPRAAWLFNATNDAWYGQSTGPHQHLDAARMRAIEQGLPLARAANTGISAMIDPYGRLIQMLPLDSRGIIDQPLPKPLPPTPYARWGELLSLLMLTFGLTVTQLSLSQARK